MPVTGLVDCVVYRYHAAYSFGSFVRVFIFCALDGFLEVFLELLCTGDPLHNAHLGMLIIGCQGEWKVLLGLST